MPSILGPFDFRFFRFALMYDNPSEKPGLLCWHEELPADQYLTRENLLKYQHAIMQPDTAKAPKVLADAAARHGLCPEMHETKQTITGVTYLVLSFRERGTGELLVHDPIVVGG